jgi:hypothetical protein
MSWPKNATPTNCWLSNLLKGTAYSFRACVSTSQEELQTWVCHGSAKQLIRLPKAKWVPNGPSERPQRKPGVREVSSFRPKFKVHRHPRKMTEFLGFSGPISGRRDSHVPLVVGGGRGARPETFSTFEHTHAGDVARVEI